MIIDNSQNNIRVNALLRALNDYGYKRTNRLSLNELLLFLNRKYPNGFDQILSQRLINILNINEFSTISVEDFINGYLQLENEINAKISMIYEQQRNNEDQNLDTLTTELQNAQEDLNKVQYIYGKDVLTSKIFEQEREIKNSQASFLLYKFKQNNNKSTLDGNLENQKYFEFPMGKLAVEFNNMRIDNIKKVKYKKNYKIPFPKKADYFKNNNNLTLKKQSIHSIHNPEVPIQEKSEKSFHSNHKSEVPMQEKSFHSNHNLDVPNQDKSFHSNHNLDVPNQDKSFHSNHNMSQIKKNLFILIII